MRTEQAGTHTYIYIYTNTYILSLTHTYINRTIKSIDRNTYITKTYSDK